MNLFSDDELRIILSVMSQANYPTNMFRAVEGILTKLQISLQADLQPVPPTSATPSDEKKPSRAERRRAPKEGVETPPA